MPDSAGLEALFVRLYFDRHIMARLAVDLRGRGYDVVRTEEVGKDTATDAEQLAFAAAEGRAIVTFNIRDFALLPEAWQAAELPREPDAPAREECPPSLARRAPALTAFGSGTGTPARRT